jgi:hypothetical protein
MKLGGYLKKEGNNLVSTCNTCGRDVKLNGNTKDWFGSGYFCPICKNKLAIEFEGRTYNAEELLNLEWNPALRKRANKINETLYSALGSSSRDWETFMALNYIAANDKSIGNPLDIIDADEKDEMDILLLFDNKSEKYIGFLDWTTYDGEYGNEYMNSDLLFQIYILKEERRKGYGSKALKFWAENYARKADGKFGIELSPNSQLKEVLLNLGYAEEVDGKFIPKNFYVSPEFDKQIDRSIPVRKSII